jgi:hypothetical protein
MLTNNDPYSFFFLHPRISVSFVLPLPITILLHLDARGETSVWSDGCQEPEAFLLAGKYTLLTPLTPESAKEVIFAGTTNYLVSVVKNGGFLRHFN